MSADATKISKRTIECATVERDEIIERYLVGGLSDEDQATFEQHYFECAHCFRQLQTVQAVQRELERAGGAVEVKVRRPRRWATAAGLAAAVVLAAAGALWMWSSQRSSGVPSTNTTVRVSAESPTHPLLPGSEPTAATGPSLDQLARFEPPRYEAPTLRGTPDEATERFERGMEQYRRADYRGAVADLRAAAALDPGAPHVSFFLGISQLMLGHDDAAIDRLRATIALGDTRYLESAHWYLAKAYLRRADVGAAETHLKAAVTLQGSRAGDARRLLTDLARVTSRPD